MSTYLTDMKAAVRTLIKDDPSSTADYVITDTILTTAISDFALLEFSKDSPYKVKKYYAGLGEDSYPLPSDWTTNLSKILSIEYDVGDQNPAINEGKDYTLYEPDVSHYTIANASAAATSVTLSTVANGLFFRDGDVVTVGDADATESNRVTVDGSGTTGIVKLAALSNTYDSTPYICKQSVIRFKEDAPGTTSAFLLEYTTVHILTENVFTIDTYMQGGFKYLCAGIVCELIAANYGYSSDSSLSADNVDYLGKAEFWQRKADKFRALAAKFVGSLAASGDGEKAGGPDGASVTGEWDVSMPWGSEHVFHPKKWR
jgi:hypothetical protein